MLNLPSVIYLVYVAALEHDPRSFAWETAAYAAEIPIPCPIMAQLVGVWKGPSARDLASVQAYPNEPSANWTGRVRSEACRLAVIDS